MVRRSVLLAVFALALSGGSTARAADAGRLFGVSVNRIVNDDFTPRHWDAPLRAVRASGITQARTDAFWMGAAAGPPPPRRPPLRLAPPRRRRAGAREPPAAVAADPRLLGDLGRDLQGRLPLPAATQPPLRRVCGRVRAALRPRRLLLARPPAAAEAAGHRLRDLERAQQRQVLL